MTVIGLAAAKGAPGVTTTALALAARWPAHREPLVVEGDPSGGDLVVRLAPIAESSGGGLSEAPSTMHLAAASRAVTRHGLLTSLQVLPGPGEVKALVAPPGPFAASAAMSSLVTAGLGTCLAALEMDVLVDAGRVDLGSPTLALLTEADRVLLVARPTLESVLHTRDLAVALQARRIRPELVIVGDRPYSAAEMSTAVALPVMAVLPIDPAGAAALAGAARSAKVLARSRLLHAAGQTGEELAGTVASVAPANGLSTSQVGVGR